MTLLRNGPNMSINLSTFDTAGYPFTDNESQTVERVLRECLWFAYNTPKIGNIRGKHDNLSVRRPLKFARLARPV